MRSITVAALALCAALAGGAVPAHAAPSSAAPKYRACHDGACTLKLRKPASFRVHSRFGVTRLRVTFNSSYVRVVGTGPGVRSEVRLSRHSYGTLNGIRVTIKSLSGSKAVLRLKPVR